MLWKMVIVNSYVSIWEETKHHVLVLIADLKMMVKHVKVSIQVEISWLFETSWVLLVIYLYHYLLKNDGLIYEG